MAITLFSGPTLVTESLNVAATTVNSVPVGAGIIVATRWQTSAASISSVTCTGEANLTATSAVSTNATNSENFQFFRLSNVTASGNKTITVTWGSGTNADAVFFVVQGQNTTEMFDVDNATSGASGVSGSVSLVTTSTADMIVMLCNSNFGGQPAASGAGYIGLSCTGYNNFCSEEYNLNVGGAGTYNPTMTWAGSDTWFVKAAAFKVASGTASGPPPVYVGNYG